MIERGWDCRTGFVCSDWLSLGSELGQHLRRGTETEWKRLSPSPGSGHQRHSRDRENRGIRGNFDSGGAEAALGDPGHAAPERPGLRAVRRVLPPPGLFRVRGGLGALRPQGGLWVFGATFVFGTEAVVWLSSVFLAVVALRHRVGFAATALGLGRPV